MNAPLLAVDNVGCKFGGFVALEGVTTAFEPGKVTSIIGPNGELRMRETNHSASAVKTIST